MGNEDGHERRFALGATLESDRLGAGRLRLRLRRWHRGIELLIELAMGLGHLLDRELALRALAQLEPALLPVVPIPRQPGQCVHVALDGVAGGDQRALDLVQQLADGGQLGRDDRQPHRHRLEEDAGDALVRAGHQQGIACRVPALEAGGGVVEDDHVAQALRLDPLPHLGLQFALADDVDLEADAARAQGRGDIEHQSRVLLRHQPSGEEDLQPVGGQLFLRLRPLGRELVVGVGAGVDDPNPVAGDPVALDRVGDVLVRDRKAVDQIAVSRRHVADVSAPVLLLDMKLDDDARRLRAGSR